jgi:hypothetical protein
MVLVTMDDSVITTRPATRDRSLSMPEINSSKMKESLRLQSNGSSEIEVIDVGANLGTTARVFIVNLWEFYWRFCGNTVEADHRSASTVLPQNLQ